MISGLIHCLSFLIMRAIIDRVSAYIHTLKISDDGKVVYIK